MDADSPRIWFWDKIPGLGKANVVADALSRKVSLLAISVISSTLVEEVKGKINQDSFFAPIIALREQNS